LIFLAILTCLEGGAAGFLGAICLKGFYLAYFFINIILLIFILFVYKIIFAIIKIKLNVLIFILNK